MSAMDMDFAEEELVENPTLKAAFSLAPLHHNQPLNWDYEVDLIGEKIYDKIIHLCEICELPILVYGRMLPCKHVFCFACARKCEKTCKRCGNKVQKVEKSALGTVYVCTYGAPKHSINGCRRTYLSQRDLQSHIGHRHLPKTTSETKTSTVSTVSQSAVPQLPLTQQQAALQQAAQATSQSPPVSVPSLSVQPPAPSVLVPNLASLTPPQPTQPPHSGSLNSAVIPGLGDLQQGTTAGQASPARPPDLNPNPMGLGINFNIQSQLASDHAIYRSHDVGPIPQHHQQQQQQMQQQQIQQQTMLGLNSNPMPGLSKPKPLQRFGDPPSQHPVSGAMMPSLNPQQMSGLGQTSQSLHLTAQMHQQQQQLLQEQQQQLLREQQQQQQQRLQEQQQQRLNLQHHESISKMPSAMLSSTHARPQVQSNLDNFASSPGSFEPLQTGPGRTNNVNLITVPIHDEGRYSPMSMVGQSQGSSLPFPPLRSNISSQNFSQHDISPGMNPKAIFSHIGNKAGQSPNLGGGFPQHDISPGMNPKATFSHIGNKAVQSPILGGGFSQPDISPGMNPKATFSHIGIKAGQSPNLGGGFPQHDISPGMNPKATFSHIGNKAGQSPNLGGGFSQSDISPGMNPKATFSHIGNKAGQSPNLGGGFSQPDVSTGMNPQTTFSHIGNKAEQSPNLGGGLSTNQSMPFSQTPGNLRMHNPRMMNPRTGLNNMQANAIVEMFQALARPKGGAGLMPIPGTGNQGQGLLNPRFNPANWTSGNPRSMQPRMSQNQPRPRGDGQFKHNYFG